MHDLAVFGVIRPAEISERISSESQAIEALGNCSDLI